MKLSITVRQEIKYSQVVEVSEKTLAKIKEASDRKILDGDNSPLTSIIDFREVCDSGDFSDLEIFEVDAEGKPVQDGYERF